MTKASKAAVLLGVMLSLGLVAISAALNFRVALYSSTARHCFSLTTWLEPVATSLAPVGPQLPREDLPRVTLVHARLHE